MGHSPRKNSSSPLHLFLRDFDAARTNTVSDGPKFAARSLTPRERDVLDWVAAGKTNREVAEILGTSPRTVQKHLEHVFTKLGVETRTAAVMRALSRTRSA
jgi:DNA-binding CsgD family transcriptional regulator